MKLYYFPASLLTVLSIKHSQVFSQEFLPPKEGGDIDEDGSIIHPGDWSDECDPWKTRPIDMETDYNSTSQCTLQRLSACVVYILVLPHNT
mgnify:CR=1 FL=1